MTENGSVDSTGGGGGGTLTEDDDVYEDDSDFEYLNIPGYEYADGPDTLHNKAHTSEATPLWPRHSGNRNYKTSPQHHTADAQIPFSSIHKKPLPYDSDDRVCFIPTKRVDVEITDVERTEHHVLNPNLYTIKVTHGEFTWTVRKRYKHFRSLHDQLVLFRAKLHIPVPTRRHRMQRRSFKQRRESLPRFPRRPEMLVDEDDLPERKKQLVTYLQRILRIPPLRNHHETLNFFEVSHLSFVSGLGAKYHEGLIKKRSGGRSAPAGCWSCCAEVIKNATAHYNKRWIVLKDTFLAYINPHQGTVSDVLLMDETFKIECGFLETGVRHGIEITSRNRHLMLKGWTHRNAQEWKDAILHIAETSAKDFTTPNRYDSFAPVRPNAHAQWFIDGAGYMSAVADAMEAAKEEIFITDWWLSPEIYMKRPMTEGDRWRLDMILKRKAADGVKIFVILFKEVEVALGINSFYTKSALLKLHPTNIKVLRHPDVVSTGVVLWSHHEKMVVIDQRIAFLGGIDLCYGRYDTGEHRLTDLGSIVTSPEFETEMGVISEEPTTPSTASITSSQPPFYDRSVSSHSWPETDVDKTKLSLHRSGGLDEVDLLHKHETHGSLHKRLTTISEASFQSSTEIPQISLEGAVITETDTDHPQQQQTIEQNQVHSVSPNEIELVGTQDATYNNTQVSDESDSSKVQNHVTVSARTDQNSNQMQNSPRKLSAQMKENSVPTLENTKVPKDEYLQRGVSVESGHVNHAAEFTPTHENKTPVSQQPATNEQVIVPQVTLKVSAAPGEKSGVTFETTDGRGERPTEAASSGGGWRKLRAIKYLKHWQKGGDSSDSDDPEYEEKVRRKKRPPNLKLMRQGRVEGDDTLELPPGAVKPTTPKPRKKIVQKAHDMRADIKDRFRKKQSKSVDVAGDTEFDFSFYKTLEDTGRPEGILEDLGLEGSTKIWIGKDYVNFISKDFVELDKPFTDFIDRTKTPRMPWHDIGAVVYGKPARDVARHFIHRWNFTKVQKRKTNMGYPLLLPKCYTKVTVPRGALASSIPCKVQILRSSAPWSSGIAEVEQSIHNAYIDLINNSKHYIYIENQFFVTIADHNQVENKIAEALFERIMKAHNNNEVLRVYVVMPLLPAFEGEMGTTTGGAIQAIQHWNYASICRGGKSILERLTEAGIQDPREYIAFFGLRTHGDLSNTLVTELVYVHSKMMIVDDRYVIIGSANINDRSLLGSRDSEMAILTEDTRMRKSRMNGKDYEAGWFASGLRMSLFREHLGVSLTNADTDVHDPVISDFYHGQWLSRSTVNTKVYEEVFRCIPTDEVLTFTELTEYQKLEGTAQINPGAAREQLKEVRGHLVDFPLKFLQDSNLQPSPLTKEGIAPMATWT